VLHAQRSTVSDALANKFRGFREFPRDDACNTAALSDSCVVAACELRGCQCEHVGQAQAALCAAHLERS
jgi:hypothetical protein